MNVNPTFKYVPVLKVSEPLAEYLVIQYAIADEGKAK
jgi:hypothetical protein